MPWPYEKLEGFIDEREEGIEAAQANTLARSRKGRAPVTKF